MKYSIIWTKQALKDVDESLDYLIEKWRNQTSLTFLERIEFHLNKISKSPKTFLRINPKKNIFKFLINKRITLYYQVDENRIYLLTFWNNSRHEEKLSKILKRT
jgi:plasmid stabilization system protein ParE